jgi:hypothetical protein
MSRVLTSFVGHKRDVVLGWVELQVRSRVDRNFNWPRDRHMAPEAEIASIVLIGLSFSHSL